MKDRLYGRASYTDEKLRADKKPTVDDVESVIKSSLKKGSKGEDVRIMQQMLITCGYDIGNTGVDGLFGPKTLAAVKQFQSKHNILSGSGSVDQQTWDALKKLYYKRLKNTSKKKEITKDVSTYVKKQAGLINP